MARVSTGYHIEFKSFFYSVPHGLSKTGSSVLQGNQHAPSVLARN
ncbi:hypothetical protein Arad_4827 [Rhizobium rhizogenes K84]|uniref:Uncharacterized protein n=1 Tax=Rhizobium rhizogenes (strain K84 / ATCC BAA-868) TaxID=311403 RepID=B9JE96_RHIR8|nr:hypothetical protein Arad_4827 [Rhizobium rhizogenes K84]